MFNTIWYSVEALASVALCAAIQYAPGVVEKVINDSTEKVAALCKKTDLTPRVVKAIENAPRPNLTKVVFDPSENKNLPLRIVGDIVRGLGVGEKASKAISNKVIEAPKLPPVSEKMLDKRVKTLEKKGQELNAKKEELKAKKEMKVSGGLKKLVKTKFEIWEAGIKLKTEQEKLEVQQEKLSNKMSVEPQEEPKSTADKIIYKVIKTLFATISKEKNISNVLNILFIKFTEVLTALQKIDWVHSSDIKQDFAERLTNNMNIGPDGFETFKKKKVKKIRKNASKILSKIEVEVQGVPATAALKIMQAAINNGPLEKVLCSVIKTLSDLLFDRLIKIFSPEQIQGWIENGIDLGPLKLFGQKKLFITPDDATYQSLSDDEKIKRVLYQMIEMVVFTLIDVLIDALANFIDWSSSDQKHASGSSQKTFEDFIVVNSTDRTSSDQKRMPVDLQRNFEGFIDAVRMTFGAVLGSTAQRDSEKNVAVNKPGSNENVGILGSFENLILRALLGGAPTAAKVPCWFIKKIRIEEVVSTLSTYLKEVALT